MPSWLKTSIPFPRSGTSLTNSKVPNIFQKWMFVGGLTMSRLKQGDEYKAAFITHHGLFETLVMQFRLCNTPATFQQMMNKIFQDEIRSGKVVIYIDNILVFTADLDEHCKLVWKILQHLEENNVSWSLRNANARPPEPNFLGWSSNLGK